MVEFNLWMIQIIKHLLHAMIWVVMCTLSQQLWENMEWKGMNCFEVDGHQTFLVYWV